MTSQSSPLRVDWLPFELPGAVGLTLCPGKRSRSKYGGHLWRRDLQVDLSRLSQTYRADVLVSLIEDHELTTYGVPSLYSECESRGLEVWRLPIRDVSTPAGPQAVVELVGRIVTAASSRRRVVVHCIGGLGRTGLIAGCVLVELGHSAEDALALLATTRSPNCPETAAQRAFVHHYSTLRKGAHL